MSRTILIAAKLQANKERLRHVPVVSPLQAVHWNDTGVQANICTKKVAIRVAHIPIRIKVAFLNDELLKIRRYNARIDNFVTEMP